MARVINEKFEAAPGYDLDPKWTEEEGSGASVDPDADPTDVGDPSDWGSQCLKIVRPANVVGLATYNHGSAFATNLLYARVEVVITAEAVANWEHRRIFDVIQSSGGGKTLFRFSISKYGGDNVLRWETHVYRDGANISRYDSNVPVVLGQRVRLEFKWDAANLLWAWKIDGVAQANNVDAVYPITSEGTLVSGCGTVPDYIHCGSYAGDSEGYTAYYDLIAVDDADWIGPETVPVVVSPDDCTHAHTAENATVNSGPGRILEEDFENTGYERAGEWSETLGAGAVADEDADTADVGSPSDWGSQCLKIVHPSGETAVAIYGPGHDVVQGIFYLRTEIVITAEGLSEYEQQRIFSVLDSASSKVLFRIALNKPEGGALKWRAHVYRDGANISYHDSNVEIAIGTRYRLEFKWDPDNLLWAWKIDGVAQANDQDSTYPITSEGTLLSGCATAPDLIVAGGYAGDAETFTAYYDRLAVDNTDWIGAESSFSTISVSDAGSGADTVAQIAVSLAIGDSGAGADSLPGPSVTLGLADAGAGADLIGAITALLSVQDSGSGADLPAINVHITLTDSGSAVDAVSSFLLTLKSIADSGSGLDTVGAISVTVPVTDVGQGVDLVGAITAALSVADLGAGVDVVVSFDPTIRIVTITFTLAKRRIEFSLN